tara:strand:+ start:220 stop:3339 length:3120 start_codon:yes stop_codon:yes gene_type:complete
MVLNRNYDKPPKPDKIYFNAIPQIVPNYTNSFFVFHKVIFKNNVNILKNLNINKLKFKSVLIYNNSIFSGNIDTSNIRNKYNGYLFVNNSINNNNNILHIRNNICSDYFKLKLLKNNYTSDLHIRNNINIFNNFNLNELNIINNVNTNKNIIVNNLTTTHNLNVFQNSNIQNFKVTKDDIKLKSDISINNIYIGANFNSYGNYNTQNIIVNKDLYINNNLSNIYGIVNISNTKRNIYYDGCLYPFDILKKQNIIGRISNQEVIITDFYSYNFAHNINLYNNHHIDFIYHYKSKLKLTDFNLNISPETFIYGNSYFLYNITVTNNSNFNNKLIIHNNSSINKYLNIPSNTFITNKTYPGAITYNTNIQEINIFNNYNIWDYLQLTDKNSTGIFRKNHQFDFKIFNNTIFTYNKDGFINNHTTYNNNTFLIKDNLTINDNFYTNDYIYINNIPIQIYNNLLRSFNYSNYKWTSLTLEYLNCFYKTSYKSYNFVLHNITNNYRICNTYNYLNPSNVLFNKYNLFDLEIINHTTYITHLHLNLVSKHKINNTFYIHIYKNYSIFHTITINTNSDYLYKFYIPIMYYKNDVMQIYVKSKYIVKNSIKINIYGYHKTYTDLIGDSNFFTDTPIYFNNNTTSDVDLHFYNNINVNNSLVIHSNTNNHDFIINKLSFSKNTYNDTLFEIDDKLFINHNSIGFGDYPQNAFIDIINKHNHKYAFINKGSIKCDSNVNVLNNVFANNINVNNNINANNIFTNLLISNNLHNLNTIHTNNINIYSNINLQQNTYTYIKNLKLSIYDSNLTILPNSCYISKTTNKNILFKYNSTHMNIYPTNLHISNNSNDLNFNNFIKIKNNDVSIATTYNSNNIVTISDVFHIQKNNNNTYINNDLILNNINICEKFKSLIYDLKGPENINVYYDFYNNPYNSNIILYNSSAPIVIPFSNANIQIIKKNNIIYHTLLHKPYHIFYDFKSYIDVLHFTDIVLKDNTIRNFMNNIKSYATNIPSININIKFNQDGTTIYPYYTFNISNSTYTVYGLKSYIV